MYGKPDRLDRPTGAAKTWQELQLKGFEAKCIIKYMTLLYIWAHALHIYLYEGYEIFSLS